MVFEAPPPAVNNPWEGETSFSSSQTQEKEVEVEHQFEDNFSDQDPSKPFEKLDDSDEYLEKLERKLKKLTEPSKSKTLLKALSERRTDETTRFINEEGAIRSNDILPTDDSEVDDNPVLRKLFPDKQAITVGELQKLVDADILDIVSQSSEPAPEKDDKDLESQVLKSEKDEERSD